MTQGHRGLVVDGELPQLRGRLLEVEKIEGGPWLGAEKVTISTSLLLFLVWRYISGSIHAPILGHSMVISNFKLLPIH